MGQLSAKNVLSGSTKNLSAFFVIVNFRNKKGKDYVDKQQQTKRIIKCVIIKDRSVEFCSKISEPVTLYCLLSPPFIRQTDNQGIKYRV